MARKLVIREGLSYDDVLLVPKYSTVSSRKDVDTSTWLTTKIKLKIPLISANMDTVTEHRMAISMAKLGGIGIIHRFMPIDNEALEVAKVKAVSKELLVGAAVGVRDDVIERTRALVKAKVDVVVIDVAHGHAAHTLATLKLLKKTFPKVEVIAGNVATREGTLDLIKAGADAVKVGVGPGSLCTTRLVAGCGVPQLTAVLAAVSVGRPRRIPVIADGGIKQPGDVTKALAAGADTVMIGGLFAGCEESPGVLLNRDGKQYKLTRGMASLAANREKNRRHGINDDFGLKDYVAEGIEALVPYRGSVVLALTQLMGGLRSGMSYCGARTISQLQRQAEFIRMTHAGLRESGPHDVVAI